MKVDPTVLAAVIAAAVALAGYLASQYSQRKDRRAAVFAEALRAVRSLQELPYLIWRRPGDDPESVDKLGRLQSERLSEVRFFVQLLAIEEPDVARCYHLLQLRTRRQVRAHRQLAWRVPLFSSKDELWVDPPFGYDLEPEMTLCIDTMRASLSPVRSVRLRRLVPLRVALEGRECLGIPGKDWFVAIHIHE